LLAEWNFSKNVADIYNVKMVEKVWWVCEKGHEWEARLGNRVCLNRGCPFCKGSLPSADNNLAKRFPSVAAKWNYAKNQCTPSDVLPRSTEKVWWVCEKGHEWEATPHSMTNKKTKSGCPYCNGSKPSDENNIMDIENLLAEWDYNKNKVRPEDMTRGRATKVWWKCSNGHEWKASIASRVKGSKCPFCSPRHSRLEVRIYCELQSILDEVIWCPRIDGVEIDIFLPRLKIGVEIDGYYWHKPDRRREWDSEKNSILKKRGISVIRVREEPLPMLADFDVSSSPRESHISIVMRLFRSLFKLTDDTSFIQYCHSGKIQNEELYNKEIANIGGCDVSVVDVRPELLLEWHSDRNGALLPSNMSYGSGRKVWWVCDKGHEWKAAIKNRTAGGGCPYCSGRYPTKEYNLATVYPETISIWCYEDNRKRPEDYTPYSHSTVWWRTKDGTKRQIKISDKVRYLQRRKR